MGEGNGRFLVELVRAQPELHIDCIDASSRMLEMANRRVAKEMPNAVLRVRFLNENIETCALDQAGYDLIVTHFVLDCFDHDQLEVVIPKLATAAAPDATWLVADFREPRKGLARMHARMWLKAMYLFFRVTAGLRTQKLIDPDWPIRRCGFILQQEELARYGMLKSQMWQRGN